MDVIEDEKSKDVYEALQDLYGNILDKERHTSAKMTCEKNVNLSLEPRNEKYLEFLRFQSDIHDTPVRLAAWKALTNARVLELLPPLESCFGEAEGYLQPIEDNAEIIEAYVKSWTSGALDRAASRGSIAYVLVLHHLSHFIFHSSTGDKLLLRNKLVRSLLRDFSLKQHHEAMLLNLIQYEEKASSQTINLKDDLQLYSNINKRLDVLTEACEQNSSLLNEVKKLKSLVQNTVS
ncbi:hypothetical protein L484_022889 [Morus notabilis]|uniref:RPAP1/MINIYO-like TPR repeats domain-containing protein n=1 Tax=Morus notabilis TaxID=981085 RepID=W9RVE0_9ROSA|nr:hypothetical protein L484_022889 [Morus notabilis]